MVTIQTATKSSSKDSKMKGKYYIFLQVIGMILTYFFLLLQFKNPLQGEVFCTCVWNGTNQTAGLVSDHQLYNGTTHKM